MKKKYIGGIAALLLLAAAAVLVLILNVKYTLHVSKDSGYTVQIKDVELDSAGKASVSKGKQIVFAVTLDQDYSDSNVKVKANDEQISAQNGVYRYTVSADTKIAVEGVAKNDHVVSGIDVDPGTMDNQEFTLLRDENGVPVPVLSDLAYNGVDTYDIPDPDLTANVSEAINPGWKYRTLTELNLGKYKGLKFFVKNSSYLQAKLGEEEDFYIGDAGEEWNEFFFQYEKGAVNLYINGQKSINCNYLSDVQMCLQEQGTYKFSNIYVIERKDYKGAKVTVTEGDGYYLDLPAREYALGAKLTFHVSIDDDFKKSSSFTVKAAGRTLKANDDGSYTFTLKGDTQVSVSGVVAKPLDSRYQVVDMPFFVEADETANYAIMQTVKGTKTYSYSQSTWGYVNLPEVNLEKYTSLLFFIRKDDTDENSWISMNQKEDDGTLTPYLQSQDNKWHRIEFKKEGGKIYFYADGQKYDTPVVDAQHFVCAFNDNSKVRFTSMVGIVDKNYKEPAPDYLSSKYQTIGMPMLVGAKKTDRYELIRKVKNAKTYQYVPAQWCRLGFDTEINFDRYQKMTFFIRKDDKSLQHWIVFSKVDSRGESIHDYIASAQSRWYRIDITKIKDGRFSVSVDGKKQEGTISGAADLQLTFNEESVILFTDLMGIVDRNYKEPEPDYLSSRYKAVSSPIAVEGKETDRYVLLNQVAGAKTWQYTPLTWQKVGFRDINLNQYKEAVFYIHKDDVDPASWIVLEKTDDKGNTKAQYIVINDNKWYEVRFKKIKNGKFSVYVNGEKADTAISGTDELIFTFNEKGKIRFTSLVGIADKNYKEPEPDYISSSYEALTPSLAVEGTETACYNRLLKVKDAKTYTYTTDAWGEYGFREVELNRYKSLLFFVHKEDMKIANWLEFYHKSKAEKNTYYFQKNDNRWYEIELKKTGENKFTVYINGTKQSQTVSSIDELKMTISGGATVKFTSFCGIKDPAYKEPQVDYLKGDYQTIAPAVAEETATETDVYEVISQISGAKTYSYTSEQWGEHDLAQFDPAPYKSLVFYMKKADMKTENWLEFYQSGKSDAAYLAVNDNSWHKVELTKNEKGSFDVSVDGTKKGTGISAVDVLKIRLNGSSELLFTSLVAIADPDYKEPEEEIKGVMVYASPWAYGKVSVTTDASAKKLGYAYVTTAAGGNEAYSGARLSDIDLSEYTSIRFALKSNTANWWEIGKAADHKYNLIAGNATEWVECELRFENDAFTLYENGVKKEMTLADNANLSDLEMRFAVSGTISMTEVRGEKKENITGKRKVVAGSFNDLSGTFTDEDKPIPEAAGSMIVTTTWSATKTPMADVSLAGYTKVLFYAKKTAGGGWFESNYFGSEQLSDSWVEFKLLKNTDGTWNLYRGGVLTSENVTMNNLSAIEATYGDATYAFSQVFAVEAEGQATPDTPDTPQEKEGMIVSASWTYPAGSMDHTKTYTEKGYQYATVVSGSEDTYSGSRLSDADLSLYKEVRFALKSDGNAWYEIGKVSTNTWDSFAGNSAQWTEIRLTDEGNGYFQAYVNDEWNKANFPLDMNLSELQMRFGTSGTVILTEVRGELRTDAKSSLSVIRDCIYTGTTESVSDVKMPIREATKVMKASTTWGWGPMTDISISTYQTLRFYAMNTADGDSYIELKVGKDATYVPRNVKKSWVEFRFDKNTDGTWNVYVAGQKVVENVALANLNEIQICYGTGSYYFSEVFAAKDN